ncbi:DUF7284 family protein [Natronorubrum sp. FCH18a]|uniref:DUF7284 family protein n=1 Tax=Natronorubrum sp. FCH18a TaxID=3447018 RepID=UPI003F518CEA
MRADRVVSTEPVTSDRAVSTVLDIALALLLITASVLVIGLYLNGDDDLEVDRADHTAETLSGSTVSVVYDVENVTNSSHYDEPEGIESYERTMYGPAVGTIAEAAVVNAEFDGKQLILYADSFSESVAAHVESRLVGANHQVYVTATWQPYDEASIHGNTTVGNQPPVTDDISAVTMSADSGMPTVDDEALADTYATEGADEAAELIAESIVEGYFPTERSQLALERQNLDRAIKSTHYLRMADIVGADLDRNEAPLARSEARADDANEELVDGLADLIADDLESGQTGDDLDEIGDDEDELEAYFEAAVSPGTVELTVYTWDP